MKLERVHFLALPFNLYEKLSTNDPAIPCLQRFDGYADIYSILFIYEINSIELRESIDDVKGLSKFLREKLGFDFDLAFMLCYFKCKERKNQEYRETEADEFVLVPENCGQ